VSADNDPRLIAAFRDEIDLHRSAAAGLAAAELSTVAESEVTIEQRGCGLAKRFFPIAVIGFDSCICRSTPS
jgi:DNA polymerase I-like protein with 3'-5' exonuclease and polymerase domains